MLRTVKGTVERHPRRYSRQALREALAFYGFAAPWIVNVLVLILGPMIASLALSFYHYNIVQPPEYAGLYNYRQALMGSDSFIFWKSVRVTLDYAVISVPVQLLGGFLVALLMNQEVRGIRVFRLIYYLPAVTSGVASALLWRFALHPEWGVFNYVLYLLGMEPIPWITSTWWALPSLVIISLWGMGGPMIIYLAGFKSIPAHLYEAAHLDGANAWQRFRNVTIPMISPVIFFNLVMGIVNSFQVFTSAYAVTGGGPARATYVFMLYLYDVAFTFFRMGYGSAAAWLIFCLIVVLTWLAFRYAGRRVYYEGGAD